MLTFCSFTPRIQEWIYRKICWWASLRSHFSRQRLFSLYRRSCCLLEGGQRLVRGRKHCIPCVFQLEFQLRCSRLERSYWLRQFLLLLCLIGQLTFSRHFFGNYLLRWLKFHQIFCIIRGKRLFLVVRIFLFLVWIPRVLICSFQLIQCKNLVSIVCAQAEFSFGRFILLICYSCSLKILCFFSNQI